MLTPAFELHQDAEYLNIMIRAPFAKVSETEIFVDEAEFKFYSKPYYLRLNLPGKIAEDGREKAKYDTDTGAFSLKFPKQVAGEVFEGLDMLTKLLAPSGESSAQQPLVEVLDGSTVDVDSQTTVETEEEDFDWQIDQEPYTEDNQKVNIETPSYGFANSRTGVFRRLQTELHDIIDLKEADDIPNAQRQCLRMTDEQEHFDEGYYLSDLHENDDMVQELLSYQPSWADEYTHLQGGDEEDDIVKFTDEEKEQMRKLPRKQYILDSGESRKVLLGLVDIIYAYCYNHRTMEGENTVESGWTIAKLSATLSWLQTFASLRDVITTCYRRSLTYPLYRHWQLSTKVLRDTQKIFTLGRRGILKCLLEIHKMLSLSDPRYILNDLYITDYCVWIQGVKQRQLESLTRSLKKVKVSKGDVGFELDIVEQAAVLAMEEEQTTDSLMARVEQLNIDSTPPQGQQADGSCESHKVHDPDGQCAPEKSSFVESLNSGRAVDDQTSGSVADCRSNDESCESETSDSDDTTDSDEASTSEASESSVNISENDSRLCSSGVETPCAGAVTVEGEATMSNSGYISKNTDDHSLNF